MGRYALTANLGLEKAGVVCEKNGKFKVNDVE
jgi:pyruvate/2-oxoglutarate dehydrogenase complex dihydrolipoamide dehydrogenase (E3) component